MSTTQQSAFDYIRRQSKNPNIVQRAVRSKIHARTDIPDILHMHE